MRLYILCILVMVCGSTRLYRLTTSSKQGESSMTPSDFMTSTLGYFRLRLVGQTCQLRIQEYIGGEYRVRGFYPEDIFKIPCAYVVVRPGILVTETEAPLLKIKTSQPKQLSATTLTIDDLGIIRLTGYSATSTQNPQQAYISAYRTPSKHMYSTSNMVVASSSTLPLVVNEGGWGFSARNGEFRIFNTDDPSQIVRYRYVAFTVNPGRVLDRLNHEPPLSNIDGMNYDPKCGYVEYLNFKYPLLFQIDKYWPELRVLDQGGYQILAIRYPDYNCIMDLGINEVEGQKQCMGWFCPEGTFQLEGKCVLVCPSPYYHQVRSNSKNKCVLNCQQGSTVNQQSRICTCGSPYQPFSCPNGTRMYALGCYCLHNGDYYNGISCTEQCPLGYLNLSLAASAVMKVAVGQLGGVCIRCPYKCLRCGIETRKIASTFLVCRQCTKGYTIHNGVCQKQCQRQLKINKLSPSQRQSLESLLSPLSLSLVEINCDTPCTIQYCEVCTKGSANIIGTVVGGESGKQVCVECSRPLILFRNACIKKCPERYILKKTYNLRFYCEQIKNCQQFGVDLPASVTSRQYKQCVECSNYQGVCWIDCLKGNYFHNQSACFCIHSKTQNEVYSYGFYPQCLPVPANDNTTSVAQCQPTQHLYQPTKQCLDCPFGCLTCVHDSFGFVECTSCSPSYFLMIDMNETHYCQRDTSLTQCQLYTGTPLQKTYDPRHRVCVYNMSNMPYPIKQERTRCREQDPNCLTCLYQSATVCTHCLPDYFLSHGKCVLQCPPSALQHQKICMASSSVPHCGRAVVKEHFFLVNISQGYVDLDGYGYFLPSALYTYNKVIDPVGNIFLYAYLYNRDMGSRLAHFPFPVLQCQECEPSYAPNMYTGQCEQCVQPACLQCINSNEFPCYRCHDDYKLNTSYACVQKSEEEKDCQAGQWRNQSMICVTQCHGFWLRDARERVNCSRYCHDNEQHGKYYRVQEDPLIGSHLLCIRSKQPSPERTLTLVSSLHKLLAQTYLLMLSPVQANLHKPDVNHTEARLIMNTSRYTSKPIGQNLLAMGVEGNKIWAIAKIPTNSAIAIAIDVSRLYGRHATVDRIKNKQNSNAFPVLGSSSDGRLFLTQSQYLFPGDSPAYSHSLNNNLLIPCAIMVSLTMAVSLILVGQQMLYKTDNLVILLQTLPLLMYSLDIGLLDATLYQFFHNFRIMVGQVEGHTWLGGRLLGGIMGEPGPYVENTRTNLIGMLMLDGNLVRHCALLVLVLAGVLLVGWLLGYCCMNTQILIFWRGCRNDRQLQYYQPIPTSTSTPKQKQEQKLKTQAENQTIKTIQDKQFTQQEIYSNSAKRKLRNRRSNRLSKKTQQAKTRTAFTSRHNTKITQNLGHLDQQQPRVSLGTRLKQLIHRIAHPGSQFHKYEPRDIDHFRKIKIGIIFLVQSSSIVFIYFAIVTLRSSPIVIAGHEQAITRTRTVGIALSIVSIVVVVVYTVFRALVDRIGGIYMVKRIALATVLALVGGVSYRVGLCAVVELIFMLARLLLEELPFISVTPKAKHQEHQKQDNPKAPAQEPTAKSAHPPAGEKQRKQSKQQLSESSPLHPTQQYENISLKINRSERIQQMLEQYAGSCHDPGKGSPGAKGNDRNSRGELLEKLKQKKKKREQLANRQSDGVKSSRCCKCCENGLKIGELQHNIKPYHRILSVVSEQLLLIVCYVLLSQIDNFSQIHTATSPKSSPTTKYAGYHFSLAIIVAYVTFVVCYYLVGFGYELVEQLVQAWVHRGLTQKEKSKREGHRIVGKVKQYWSQANLLMRAQHEEGKHEEVQTSYMEFYNEHTYRLHRPLTQHAHARRSTPAREQEEVGIFNYQIDPLLYEYIY